MTPIKKNTFLVYLFFIAYLFIHNSHAKPYHYNTENKLKSLQGTWVQHKIYPSIDDMIKTTLPILHILVKKIINTNGYGSNLTIDKNKITVTSTRFLKENNTLNNIFTANGVLEAKIENNIYKPIEINKIWLFKTPYNPFLRCFSETILSQISNKIKWEASYVNLDRVKFNLTGTNNLQVTVYPNKYAKIPEVNIYYKRK